MNNPAHFTNVFSSQAKDTIPWEKQKQIFHQYLKEHTATNTMACKATGLEQKNTCRIKRELEDQGELIELFKGECQVTGCRAAYLSTNRELWPPPPWEKFAAYFKRLFSIFKREGVKK